MGLRFGFRNGTVSLRKPSQAVAFIANALGVELEESAARFPIAA